MATALSQPVNRFGNSNQSRAYFPSPLPDQPAAAATSRLYFVAVETVYAVSAFPSARQMEFTCDRALFLFAISRRVCTRLHKVIVVDFAVAL